MLSNFIQVGPVDKYQVQKFQGEVYSIVFIIQSQLFKSCITFRANIFVYSESESKQSFGSLGLFQHWHGNLDVARQ